jgi:RHS repeat-associated protein
LVYDGLQLIEERQSDDLSLRKRYTYGPSVNQLVAVETTATGAAPFATYLTITDHQGSVLGVTQADGTLVERLAYGTTGLAKLLPTDLSTNAPLAGTYQSAYVPFAWQGYYKEPITGRLHAHYRDFDPIHGRWMSEDPKGTPDGWNRYAGYQGPNGLDPQGTILPIVVAGLAIAGAGDVSLLGGAWLYDDAVNSGMNADGSSRAPNQMVASAILRQTGMVGVGIGVTLASGGLGFWGIAADTVVTGGGLGAAGSYMAGGNAGEVARAGVEGAAISAATFGLGAGVVGGVRYLAQGRTGLRQLGGEVGQRLNTNRLVIGNETGARFRFGEIHEVDLSQSNRGMIVPEVDAWPANYGFSDISSRMTLRPGAIVDRYGREGGTFVSPVGTSFPQRALPQSSWAPTSNAYRVLKPIEVDGGIIAPWWGQPGGGVQFQLPASVRDLIKSGHLGRIP